MTDLERVREALLDRKRMTEAWLPGFTEGALSDLDTHLKEDAERVAGWQQTHSVLVDELARLRERVKELEAYASAMRGSDI